MREPASSISASAASEVAPGLSGDPSALGHLTPEQTERVSAILDRYLAALEQAEPLDVSAILQQNPDLADTLGTYFRSLEELHGIAGGFGAAMGETSAKEGSAEDERRIGDFRLLREIGHGGMGVVYEAQQISLGRHVALKILPFAAVLDSKQIARFKNEAQAAAQLNHPHIVPVYAIGAERGVHFYAMQLIAGQPLDRLIETLRDRPAGVSDPIANTCRDPLAVVRLGIQAAEALHAAHEFGIIHRDIKPSNLLLDQDGKLWVTDFGLARFQSNVDLTKTGDVVGTRKYMSPEQARGENLLVDHRTDIYSLGVTLYELLTLRPAHPGDRPATRDLGESEPAPLRKWRPEIPADLETVIHKAIAADRDERYATAQAFADDLRCVLQGTATQARPPTVRDRIRRWAQRHRRLVAGSTAAALLSSIVLAGVVAMVLHEKGQTQKNFERAEKNFREAREVVDRFGARLAERLADVPGAAEVRRDLLQDTLTYYERFLSQSQNDPLLRAELALTYSQVAELSQEIGAAANGVAALEAARRLLSELADREPDQPEHRRRLATCLNNLALGQSRLGRFAEARDNFTAAIRLQEQLRITRPGDQQLATELASAHGNLGLVWRELGQLEQAEDSFRDSLRRLEQLAAHKPDDPESHHRLAAAYRQLAALLAESGPLESERLFGLALREDQRASELQPSDLAYLATQAVTYNDLGAAHAAQGRYDEAADAYQQAIAIQSKLIEQAPAKRSFRHDLAVTYNNLGMLQTRRGALVAAEKALAESKRRHEELIRQFPADPDLASGLGGVHNNLGNLFEESKRWQEALDAYQNAVNYQSQALNAAQNVYRYRAFLSRHYYNQGRILRQLGRWTEAGETALQRGKLWVSEPQRLVSVAEEFAQISEKIGENSAYSDDAEKFRLRALETLEQAVAAGVQLSAQDLHSDAFSSLRDAFSSPREQERFRRLTRPPGN